MKNISTAIAWILIISFMIAVIFMFQSYPGTYGLDDESLWTKAVELSSLWFDAQIQNYK